MSQRKYAYSWWVVDDVVEKARELELDIDRKLAKEILQKEERRLADAMCDVGWEILEDAIQRHSSRKQ